MDFCRIFVMLPEFDHQWVRLGLGDEELRLLQSNLVKKPNLGSVIKGAGGLRKLRIKLHGCGKRGGGRVLYVDFPMYEIIFLVTVFSKSEQSDLTNAQLKTIALKLNTFRRKLKNTRR